MKLAVEMVGCEDGRAVAREMRNSRSQAAGGAEREEKKNKSHLAFSGAEPGMQGVSNEPENSVTPDPFPYFFSRRAQLQEEALA